MKRPTRERDALFARVTASVVAGLFVFVLVLLLLLAAIGTCFLTFEDGVYGDEYTFFVADSPLLNCVAVAAAVAAALAVSRSPLLARFRGCLSDDRFFRKCKLVLLAFLLVAALLWIALTLALPGSDQRTLQQAVLRCAQGDWSPFETGGYLSKNTHQIGFFWFSMPFALIFGRYASGVLEVSNVFALAIACETLSWLSGRFGASRLQQLLVMCAVIAFYPLIQFCSFVYGILWGFAFALLAVKFEILFFDGRRWRHAVAAAICIAVAMMLKSNYSIFFIAMVLYALVELADSRKLELLGLMGMLLAAFFVQSTALIAVSEKVSGQELDHPCSSWGYIAMGLQDGSRAPGWYNSYNMKSYSDAGYDPVVQAEANKADIARSLADFASGKRDAVRFFSQKIASQWNNPTFQGYWNVERRRAFIELQPFMKEALSAGGVDSAVRCYLNYFQFVVLAGALFWSVAIPWRKRGFYRVLILPLAFLGGFACHLVWEAKSQYAVQYFALLLPFAVMGYAKLVECLRAWFEGGGSGAPNSHRVVEKIGLAARARKGALLSLAASCVFAVVMAAHGAAGCVTSDTEAYSAWLASNPTPPIVERTSIAELSEEDIAAKVGGKSTPN